VTGAPVPLAHLPGYLPDLVATAAMIAVVPTDPGAPWAADAAWSVARAAAVLGHRTVLVDCFVDEPRLHAASGPADADGIVDAFEYGASLSRIAQPQPESGLFFVPTGTFASDPSALLSNPRWARLAAGFRHEGALLVLYLPSGALPSIAQWSDAIIALAPEGFDFDRDAPGGLVEAEQAGKPMVVVTPDTPAAEIADVTPGFEGSDVGFGNTFELVDEPFALPSSPAQMGGYAPTAYDAAAEAGTAPFAEAWQGPPAADAAPAPEAAPPADEGEPGAEGALPARPALRRARAPLSELDALRAPQRTRRVVVYAGVFVVAVWLAMVALRPEWVIPVAPPEEAPALARATHLPESLPWVVQVSAWNDLPRALEALDTLAARGVRALVTPVRVGKRISYRVQAGPLTTQSAAETLLDTLRAHSLADPDGSVALALPLSFAIGAGGGGTGEQVRAERDSLRAHGVPAFLLAEPGGRLRLYAGAFENAGEAAVLDSLLFTLGRVRRLGPRVGFVP
jgi:hypothetical protein